MGGALCSNMDADMTPDVAMETGRARGASREELIFREEEFLSLTPPAESVLLMTLAGREAAEASEPSRLIPARGREGTRSRLSCFIYSKVQ